MLWLLGMVKVNNGEFGALNLQTNSERLKTKGTLVVSLLWLGRDDRFIGSLYARGKGSGMLRQSCREKSGKSFRKFSVPEVWLR